MAWPMPSTLALSGRGGSCWCPRESLLEAVAAREAAGWRLAGTWASEALRIAAWRPRLATEVDHKTIPHELDWLRTAVHLHKGCYRGQETVARVHNMGRPPRRLVMAHLDGSGHLLPEIGASVEAGDRAVGVVTSVARHHELGPVALAVVKRSTPDRRRPARRLRGGRRRRGPGGRRARSRASRSTVRPPAVRWREA